MKLDEFFTSPPDSREATWLNASLEKSWGRQQNANYVAAIVPKGFAAYARILHPAYDVRQQRMLSWQEAAAHFGRVAHAQMQWHALTQPQNSDVDLADLDPPATGHLPEAQATALVDILHRHTQRADAVYFAFWEGWAALDHRQPGQEIPSFHLPDRAYFLLHAPISAAARSLTSQHRQSANLWWPTDRAWCVATEIDLMWTYVGGSKACIAEIVADSRLEAWQTTLDDRVDVGGDQINRGIA